MAHASATVSIAAIADDCQLSPSYFIRAFRHTVGATPYQWQLAQRIERARALLAGTAMSIIDVGSACGFSDQTHFTRVFTKLVGIAPGRWRKQA